MNLPDIVDFTTSDKMELAEQLHPMPMVYCSPLNFYINMITCEFVVPIHEAYDTYLKKSEIFGSRNCLVGSSMQSIIQQYHALTVRYTKGFSSHMDEATEFVCSYSFTEDTRDIFHSDGKFYSKKQITKNTELNNHVGGVKMLNSDPRIGKMHELAARFAEASKEVKAIHHEIVNLANTKVSD